MSRYIIETAMLDYITLYYTSVAHGSVYSNCTDGQVRLFGGATEYEGTVEICLNNAWGTISGYAWSDREARTVCNSLGYTAGMPNNL